MKRSLGWVAVTCDVSNRAVGRAGCRTGHAVPAPGAQHSPSPGTCGDLPWTRLCLGTWVKAITGRCLPLCGPHHTAIGRGCVPVKPQNQNAAASANPIEPGGRVLTTASDCQNLSLAEATGPLYKRYLFVLAVLGTEARPVDAVRMLHHRVHPQPFPLRCWGLNLGPCTHQAAFYH